MEKAPRAPALLGGEVGVWPHTVQTSWGPWKEQKHQEKILVPIPRRGLEWVGGSWQRAIIKEESQPKDRKVSPPHPIVSTGLVSWEQTLRSYFLSLLCFFSRESSLRLWAVTLVQDQGDRTHSWEEGEGKSHFFSPPIMTRLGQAPSVSSKSSVLKQVSSRWAKGCEVRMPVWFDKMPNWELGT